MLTMFFSVEKQKHLIEKRLDDLGLTLDEAKKVRDELEKMMQKSVEISKSIGEDVEETIHHLTRLSKGEEIKDIKHANITDQEESIYTVGDQLDPKKTEDRTAKNIIEKAIFPALAMETSKDNDESEENQELKPEETAVLQYNETEGSRKSKESNFVNEVYSLYQAGHSIQDIAKTLSRGQGEISLALNLINKKRIGS